MGSTGAGKSKLAIDLAAYFPIEVINADSMQVYGGLDVLTNKVPLDEQKGVPHHLLGTVNPNEEFTAKMFRDLAIPLIDRICSRNHLPVIVGGTNYYIQALVSPFLMDEAANHMDDGGLSEALGEEHPDSEVDSGESNCNVSFDRLKAIDPIAANRIHPNNKRKINQYLSLYARSGVVPSKLFQEKTVENWGRVENFRYRCCFICVDASLPVLDRYVEERVDVMVDSGLLNEVCDIYDIDADYSRGLRQAIGVREFETFLRVYLSKIGHAKVDASDTGLTYLESPKQVGEMLKENMKAILESSIEDQLKVLLEGAIESVKANTRRLVRQQKRRIQRLQTLFGWDINFVDSTEAISCRSNDSWDARVVEPAVEFIRNFQDANSSESPDLEARKHSETSLSMRDLWTQYVCKACGDRVLRGAHEWEQHRQGRSHRKRAARMKKLLGSDYVERDIRRGAGIRI
ncbi:hypothetical protein CRG98_000821 [Punica granatum]|uniref:tRNA dimethylallyltransferase 2 n=1 Tax=Punica granatum TaxID=22663 RepID=A0A2I0LDK1_PUNGR|nr:hypothetical protein CRG98_000821 [Punica granatum]